MATHVTSDDCKLYALGVLDGEEKDALTAHLRACPDCATNIAWAHQMIALVGFASIPALPRTSVKDKILRRIRAENPDAWNPQKPVQIAELVPKAGPETQSQPDEQPSLPDAPQLNGNVEAAPEAQSQPSEQPSSPDAPQPDLNVEAAPETQSQPSEQPTPPDAPQPDLRIVPATPAKPDQPPPQWVQREPLSYRHDESEPESASIWRTPFITAGLALLVLAGVAARLWQQDHAHQRQADALQATATKLRQDLQSLQTRSKVPEPTGEDRVLAAPGSVHIVLTGAAGHGGVLYNTHDGTVVCSATLPPPPPGKKYQLWAFSWTGVPVNLGAISPTEPASLTTHVRPGPWESRFVITAEPDTGSPAPSGTRMLAGGLEE